MSLGVQHRETAWTSTWLVWCEHFNLEREGRTVFRSSLLDTVHWVFERLKNWAVSWWNKNQIFQWAWNNRIKEENTSKKHVHVNSPLTYVKKIWFYPHKEHCHSTQPTAISQSKKSFLHRAFSCNNTACITTCETGWSIPPVIICWFISQGL